MQCPRLTDLPKPTAPTQGWPWTRESPRVPERLPDGSAWPRISVITPSYQQGEFLEKTLRSVQLQGYPNLEHIVIDGGSDDGSVEILKRYSRFFESWTSEADDGQSDAINKGMSRATGEILTWLNSDDVYPPGTLEIVARTARLRPDCDAWVGIGHKVDPTGRVLHVSPRRDLSFNGILDWPANHFAQPACFFSRRAWDSAGPLDQALNYCMDFDLWLKMARAGIRFAPIERVLALMLAHPAAKTTSSPEHTQMEVCLVIDRHGGHDLAMRRLGEMADELARFRRYKSLIDKSPLFELFLPLWKRVRKLILSQ